MTTVINNPGDGGGAGMLIGVIVVIILGALFFVYALPAMRNSDDSDKTEIKVEIPTGGNDEQKKQY